MRVCSILFLFFRNSIFMTCFIRGLRCFRFFVHIFIHVWMEDGPVYYYYYYYCVMLVWRRDWMCKDTAANALVILDSLQCIWLRGSRIKWEDGYPCSYCYLLVCLYCPIECAVSVLISMFAVDGMTHACSLVWIVYTVSLSVPVCARSLCNLAGCPGGTPCMPINYWGIMRHIISYPHNWVNFWGE